MMDKERSYMRFQKHMLTHLLAAEEGSLEDIDDCPVEKNLNFYCYTDDEDWHSHDPATHEHGYWDEMLWDVQESETIEDDD